MTTKISELAAALGDAFPAKRSQAAEQLCHLGTEAQEAALALVRACADSTEEVREWAVAALEALGPPLAADIAPLAALLRDENSDVGYWAATLLGRCRTKAEESKMTW